MSENILKNKLANAYHDVIDEISGEKVLKKDGTVKRTLYIPKGSDFSSRAAFQCFNGELTFAAEAFDKIGTKSGRAAFLDHMNKAIEIMCSEAEIPAFKWDEDDARVIASACASVKTDAYSNATNIVTNSEVGLKRLVVEDAFHILNREARPRRTLIKNEKMAEKAAKRREREAKAVASAADAEDKARAEAVKAGKADPVAA